jgi:hypothetical protein
MATMGERVPHRRRCDDFAVSKSVSGLNLDTVGIMLMLIGAAGLIISLVVRGTARVRGSRMPAVQETTPVQAGKTVVPEAGR